MTTDIGSGQTSNRYWLHDQ